jgi:cell division protein FtsL
MNFNRLAKNALCIVIVMFSITISAHVKNSVYKMENELKQITTQNIKDAENIHILDAEWSTLNNPTRLRKLAKNHIDLKPIKAEQIINYSALPFNHENSESRRIAARKSISNHAEHNKELKRLTKAQR